MARPARESEGPGSIQTASRPEEETAGPGPTRTAQRTRGKESVAPSSIRTADRHGEAAGAEARRPCFFMARHPAKCDRIYPLSLRREHGREHGRAPYTTDSEGLTSRSPLCGRSEVRGYPSADRLPAMPGRDRTDCGDHVSALPDDDRCFG